MKSRQNHWVFPALSCGGDFRRRRGSGVGEPRGAAHVMGVCITFPFLAGSGTPGHDTPLACQRFQMAITLSNRDPSAILPLLFAPVSWKIEKQMRRG